MNLTLLKPIDDFLNHTTMYRLVVFYCLALLGGDFVLGLVGYSQHDPAQIAFSTLFICAICWATNRAFAWGMRVPVNVESVWITGLILALIMAPAASTDQAALLGLGVASFVAIASKFILALNRKHIFNPVALGAIAATYAVDYPPTWWVGGTVWLLPIILLGGLLILRKLKRFEMFAAYVVAYLAVTFYTATSDLYVDLLSGTFLASPLLFCGFAMLTEPMTAPAGRWASLGFGALVGAFSSPAAQIMDFYFTSEMALLMGNVLAWAVNPKYRFKLTLERIERTAAGCYDYVFHSNRALGHEPGQYLDWTIGSSRNDNRGNRRTFTIASSPAETKVRLGVKFYPGASAYKQTMLGMKPGEVIYGSQLGGEFTLPKGDEKLAFIAGGIGITPFRAMLQHMLDVGDKRAVTLFYGNNRSQDIAYGELFNRAKNEIGLNTVYAVAEVEAGETKFHNGYIDADLIKRQMPDYAERLFYISGPRVMVLRFEKTLRELGISRKRIKTDYFPGFA